VYKPPDPAVAEVTDPGAKETAEPGVIRVALGAEPILVGFTVRGVGTEDVKASLAEPKSSKFPTICPDADVTVHFSFDPKDAVPKRVPLLL
jgi:hypothetical protein